MCGCGDILGAYLHQELQVSPMSSSMVVGYLDWRSELAKKEEDVSRKDAEISSLKAEIESLRKALDQQTNPSTP